MALDNNQLDEVMEILSKVLDKSMTEKQKSILLALAKMDLRLISPTSSVRNVRKETGFAESTIWQAFSLFKELGVVSCNNNTISITRVGRLILNAGGGVK
ncbi:MAG TPA: hypothetical protein VJH04_02905 [archaeon]|nr:hypothetical protein [archaeon]